MLQYTGYLSTMIGILIPLLLMTSPAKAWEVEKQQPYEGMLPDNSQHINSWIQKMKQWELEQSINDPAFDINNALEDLEIDYGSYDPTEQEKLLQLSCHGDNEGARWRYDRCANRSWLRPF